MAELPPVGPLAPELAGRAGAMLARAFFDYPSNRAIIPDSDRRRRISPSLHGMLVRYCLRFGEVHATAGLEGVACWLPPSAPYMTPLRMIRVGAICLPARLGWRGFRILARSEALMDRSRRRTAPTRHWYLPLLGVDPPQQGRGLGSALLRPILVRADAEGVPAYLETVSGANVGFYEKHGFRVMYDADSPAGGFHVWGLMRTPGG